MGSLLKNRMDDLLSADVGKHDYDWLLTPPGTPTFSFSESIGNPTPKPSPRGRSRSNARSASTGKTSRFSIPQAEHAASAKPARSSSTTRSSSVSIAPSSSSTLHSSNSRTAILNTSTASVTSKPPAAAAGNRPSRLTSAVPSHSASSHSPTPVKTRASAQDKPRPAQNPRSCTPPVRPQVSLAISNSSTNATSPAGVRSNPRPSTPTRRAAAAAPSARSASVGRAPATNSSKSTGATATRPNSPARPLVALPERAVSAGRQRAAPLSLRGSSKSETAAPTCAARRQSASPVAVRGRLQENASGNRMNSKANEGKTAENKKQQLSAASEVASRRTTKQSSPTENAAFGRSVSKRSIDIAIEHMEVRQSMAAGIRSAALFPQSIRSSGQKVRPGHSSEPPVAPSAYKRAPQIDDNGASSSSSTEAITPNSINLRTNGVISTGKPSNDQLMVMARKVNKVDIYESSRYDAILQKEDSKSMNWLHSIEDNFDQSPPFDYRFGSLPEPFGFM